MAEEDTHAEDLEPNEEESEGVSGGSLKYGSEDHKKKSASEGGLHEKESGDSEASSHFK